MDDKRKPIYAAIETERLRQICRYGEATEDQHTHGHYTWAVILGEEVGEVHRSVLERGRPDRIELVQLAAVAVAWIESLDAGGEDNGES